MTRPSTSTNLAVHHVTPAAPSHQRGLPGHPGPRPAPGHRSSAVARPDAGAVAPQRTRSLHGGLEALGCRRHVQAVARWPLGRLRAGLVRLMERIAERCPTRTPARARPPAPRRNRRFPFLAGLIVTSGWRTSPIARHVLGFNATGLSLASVIGCRSPPPPPPPPPPRYAGWIAEARARIEAHHRTREAKPLPRAKRWPFPHRKPRKGRADTDLPSTTLSSPALPHYH